MAPQPQPTRIPSGALPASVTHPTTLAQLEHLLSQVYTKPMLYDLLGSNGFKGKTTVDGKTQGTLETAAAIIEAESGGNPLAHNVNADGSVDRGIFQINNRAHPEVSDACAYNPQCAVKAALKISNNGTDWSPWASSKSVWSKAIGEIGSLASASGVQSEGIPTPSVPNPLAALSRIADLLTSGDFWIRLGEGLLGALLLLMGLRSLTGDATTPLSLARKVAPL